MKNIEFDYKEVLEHSNCTFLGNVEIPKHIKIDNLKEMYSGVILATGADGENDLGINGEHHILSA